MKKNAYLILIFITSLLFLMIVIFSKKKVVIPGFKERTGEIAMSAEWLNAKQAIEGLLAKLRDNPKDYKSMLALTEAYIQEARVTGDHGYYDKAALELVDNVLQDQPSNFEALTLKAVVLLSQHHFADGLDVGRKALAINPYNAFIYGILCDAYVELGRYDSAVKVCDKMVATRPDIRSYSRISYLREIFGNLPGAISAIKLAVSCGYPGLEQTEWTRMILGHLYENLGELDSAKMQYDRALIERPDYPFALAGLGRITKAQKNYPEAIKNYEKAKSLIVEFSFSDELTDLYRLNNEPDKAKKSAQDVVEQLGANAGSESQINHGHYSDKELAYAYLKIPDLDKALQHAKLEYDRRPDNIDCCEVMAWVHYKRGEFADANTFINSALRTHSKNPILLCRAGLIKIKAGDKENGVQLIKQAIAQDPFLDIDLRNEAAPYLSNS
jgi:tetratricopeptide (TPR) repeat protein